VASEGVWIIDGHVVVYCIFVSGHVIDGHAVIDGHVVVFTCSAVISTVEFSGYRVFLPWNYCKALKHRTRFRTRLFIYWDFLL